MDEITCPSALRSKADLVNVIISLPAVTFILTLPKTGLRFKTGDWLTDDWLTDDWVTEMFSKSANCPLHLITLSACMCVCVCVWVCVCVKNKMWMNDIVNKFLDL